MATPHINVGTKVTVNVAGFDALIGAAKSRNVALKGVRAGIRVLVPAARAGAPKRAGSGALRQAQGFKAQKGRRGDTVAYAVQGARTNVVKKVKTGRGTILAKPFKYDHLVQGGTKPHRLGKGEKLARERTTRSATAFVPGTAQATGGRHPGAKPNPYRRRAAAGKRDEINRAATAAMGEELTRVLAKEAAKLGM